jgi:hypothetical protein
MMQMKKSANRILNGIMSLSVIIPKNVFVKSRHKVGKPFYEMTL